MTRIVALAAGLALMAAIAIPSGALAQSNGGGNSNDAIGQIQAEIKCEDNYQKQRVAGQTGDKNGNSKDSKQLADAVTNCDHFWTTDDNEDD